MAGIDFPPSPTNGQQFTSGGVTWTWDGIKWTAASGSVIAYVPVSGGTMTGPLVLAANPTDPLGAVTKQYVDTNIIADISRVVIQNFQASGTYTPTARMAYAIIECIGGGGGGAGVITATTGLSTVAGGGGSGGYSRALVTAAQVGASQVVTVGAGGAGGAATANTIAPAGGSSAVGSLCLAQGGSGGGNVGAAVQAYIIAGGAGAPIGSAIGNVVMSGSPGGVGIAIMSGTQSIAYGGAGGAGPLGGSTVATINNPAATPVNTGGGGCGAACSDAGGFNARVGGAGSAGRVIITEFCT